MKKWMTCSVVMAAVGASANSWTAKLIFEKDAINLEAASCVQGQKSREVGTESFRSVFGLGK